jgi:eukaryotic-like serine/threonine-protein kinase
VFRPGHTVGNYRVISQIGSGGMGSVYLAEHPSIGKRVALKVIHRELSANREIVQRFFQEAKAVNKIGHDNIVVVHDFGQTDAGDNFYIMEFIAGQTLAAVMASEIILPVDRAIHIATQIAAGLEAAHSVGIIHRDVKPDNIMLSAQLRQRDAVKILDFGLAKIFGSSGPGLTAVGVMLGTPQYMSPEACQCKPNIDFRTDIYALGTLMFQMVVGRRPFDAESMAAVLMKQVIELPPSPAALEPEVSAGLDQIILRCLEKQPEQRFPSMKQLREALLDPVGYLATRPRLSPSRPLQPDEAQAQATLRSSVTQRLTQEVKEPTTSLLSPRPIGEPRSSLPPGVLHLGAEHDESRAAATVILKPVSGASSQSSYGQALAALVGASTSTTSGVALPLPAPIWGEPSERSGAGLLAPRASDPNATMVLGAAARPRSPANILLTPTPLPLSATSDESLAAQRPPRRWLVPGLLVCAGVIGAVVAVIFSTQAPESTDANNASAVVRPRDESVGVVTPDAHAPLVDSNSQLTVGPMITAKLLHVVSDPPGAQITVDGKLIGNAPLDLTIPSTVDQPLVQLNVEMSLPGFQVDRRVVSSDTTSPLQVGLIRKKTVVSSSPTSKRPSESPSPLPPKESGNDNSNKHDKDGLMKPDE